MIGRLGEAELTTAYLECFGAAPNRDDDKRLLQANAALIHHEALTKFLGEEL